jgi:peptidoglycan/LPS O-acetylase OafA/YrhL
LDGWRAIAICLVIAAHGLEMRFHEAQKLGALGVNIFFGLSGYLICTLLLIEVEETGHLSLPGFYKRRAFRILPPALAYLVVIAILGAAGVIILHKHEVLTALIAANYFSARSWFTAHFWSLGLEEHFYLFWPTLLLLLRPRRAFWAALVLVIAEVLYRPWAEAHFASASYQHTDMRLDSFLLPCMLAILLRNPRWQKRLKAFLRPVTFLVLLAVLLFFAETAMRYSRFNNIEKLLESAIIPLLIVSTVLRPGVLGSVLNASAIRWVGRISYSLYLWQELFLTHSATRPPFLWMLLCIFTCAALSYYLIERPLIRLGHRVNLKALFANWWRTPVAAAEPTPTER